MWLPRKIENRIVSLALTRPALLLTGVRQSGKSTLLQRLFPSAKYITLDKILIAAGAAENPVQFLNQFKNDKQIILDEIQYAPSLFRELKIEIDSNREENGKWLLTGSQKFTLMRGVSESLAGRISICELQTLSTGELRESGYPFETEDALWMGGYPEIWANAGIDIEHYYADYIQTYLEKDLREIIQINNIRDFRRFLRACAIRAGQLVNQADIARDIGVSANTVKSWLNTLEISGIITLLQPYYTNISKRLVKAPKLYFNDQGLLCSLLNIHSAAALQGYINEGSIWENFVLNPSRNLFFYRDQNLVEIDFLIEAEDTIVLVEAKSSENVAEQKLNFHKVRNLFSNHSISCILACRTAERVAIHLKNFTVYNPLYTDIPIG
jgi:predicted AAA+ superfamily ATPase